MEKLRFVRFEALEQSFLSNSNSSSSTSTVVDQSLEAAQYVKDPKPAHSPGAQPDGSWRKASASHQPDGQPDLSLKEFGIDCLALRAANLGFKQHRRFQSVEEAGNMVRFRTQPFLCEILLQIERSRATYDWSVGLVQGCSRSSLTADFESACWLESCCQPLASNTVHMVNDSDGIQFPFVTHTNSLLEFNKHTVVASQCQLLSYNCVFTPYMQISLALASRRHYLTRVTFRHSCTTWLVAIRRGDQTERHYHQRIKYLSFNPSLDRLYSLMTMRWDCGFQAELDHRRGDMKVVTFSESGADSPSICERPLPVYRSVLLGPTLRDTQATVLYQANTNQHALLRQPPKYITVPWGIWQRQMQRANSGLLLYSCQPDWEPRTWPIHQPNTLFGQHPEVVLTGGHSSIVK